MRDRHPCIVVGWIALAILLGAQLAVSQPPPPSAPAEPGEEAEGATPEGPPEETAVEPVEDTGAAVRPQEGDQQDGDQQGKVEGPACDPASTTLPWPASFWPSDVARAFWDLSVDDCRLARAALVAIAFLVAFLTVVATWEIAPPPVRGRRAAPQAVAPPTAETAGGEAPPAAAEAKKPSLPFVAAFEGNFGRTVISGLGGLAAVSIVDDEVWSRATVSPTLYYLVLYVVFFIALLALSAVAQGLIEAVRSRVSLVYGPSLPRPRAGDLLRRSWGWVLSWQSTFLIFHETALNLVMGRRQIQGAGFHDAIVDLHRSQVWAAERARQMVDEAILAFLKERHHKEKRKGREPQNGDVRTSISVVDTVLQSASYVAGERGTLNRRFPKGSVAWFTATTGEARWVKMGRTSDDESWGEFESYRRRSLSAGDEAGGLTVGHALTLRPPQDYEAFVMLPIPWARRGQRESYRQAALHVSFSRVELMNEIWGDLEKPPANKGEAGVPDYADWKGLLRLNDECEPDEGQTLHITDAGLRAVLLQAVEVLGEVLRYFNPRIFKEDILPHMNH